MKRSVLSAAQGGCGFGIPFVTSWHSDEFMRLHIRLVWQHHDLCVFRQAIDLQLRSRSETLELETAELRTRAQGQSLVEDDEEFEHRQVVLSRLKDGLDSFEMETASMRMFGDQLFIINLWAMAEQYCGRALMVLEQALGFSAGKGESPHRWHELATRFEKAGVSLDRCTCYSGANECRVLNNKIKHLGSVDRQLATFPRFQETEGKALEKIELDLQHYSNSIFQFVNSVIYASDLKLPTEKTGA